MQGNSAHRQTYVREDHHFKSGGKRCAAWLYLPHGKEKPPLVVMAHGFGAQRDFGLPPFAERFAQRGMAVFLFDYRGFGASEGEPRNLVNPWRHLRDWKAAVAYVRKLAQVDGGRVALWGSSYSGGHVMVTAARDGGIAAICAQANVPCWASLEQFMGCGIGACLGCVVPTYLEPRHQRVCTDGPVFDASTIAWEEMSH